MKNLLALCICAVALTGCHGIKFGLGSGVKGSGKSTTETRKVANFITIQQDAAADVTVKVGPATSVKVTADDNLQKLIKTEVTTYGALRIYNTESIRPKTKVHIEVTTPRLEGVANDGAGNIDVEGIDSKTFTASLDGAGNIKASGKTRDLTATVDGAGNLELFGLKARSVTASVDGAGNIDVSVSQSLDATVDGVGNITYRGNPGTVSRKKNGVGNISAG